MKFPQTLEEKRLYKEYFQKIESEKVKAKIIKAERKSVDLPVNALLGFGC